MSDKRGPYEIFGGTHWVSVAEMKLAGGGDPDRGARAFAAIPGVTVYGPDGARIEPDAPTVPPDADPSLAPASVAVICDRWQAHAVRTLWPDAVIVTPMAPMLGARFTRIIILSLPDDPYSMSGSVGNKWLQEFTTLKLVPGGDVVWLV